MVVRLKDALQDHRRGGAPAQQQPAEARRVHPLVVAGAVLALGAGLGWWTALERELAKRGVPLPWRKEPSRGGGKGAAATPRRAEPKGKRVRHRGAAAARAAAAAEEAAARKGGSKQGRTGGNDVPKDADILGGEEGKTFRTTSRYTTSDMYARIREERGD